MFIVNLTNLTKGCKDGQNAGNDMPLNCANICFTQFNCTKGYAINNSCACYGGSGCFLE